MSKRNLTQTQSDVLLVIQDLIALHGYGPSYQEIADELGIASKSQVGRVVEALIGGGYLTRIPRRARSITVPRPIPVPEDFPFELTAAGVAAAGAVA